MTYVDKRAGIIFAGEGLEAAQLLARYTNRGEAEHGKTD